MVCLIAGFAYISLYSLNRTDPFSGRDGDYHDIKYVLLYAVVTFLVTNNIIFHGKYDYENFCTDAQINYLNNENKLDYQNNDSDFYGKIINELSYAKDEISIAFSQIASNLGGNTFSLKDISNKELYKYGDDIRCRYTSFWESVLTNYIFFVLPFMVATNFTYMDFSALRIFNLDWADMKTWGPGLWSLFVVLITFVVSNFYYHFHYYYLISEVRLAFYVSILTVIILYFVIMANFIMYPTKQLHIHHYMFMMIVSLFTGIHGYYDLSLYGVISGIMLEGSCRWGVSPCWQDVDSEENKNELI